MYGKNKLKWGVEDAIFFKRFFDYYDQTLSESNQPLFITLATIANHFPFNSMSESQRLIYPNPSSLEEHYSNSIKLTDMGLAAFFKELRSRPELKNSIVIITGDHAFPLGEHGNYNLESGYHEESFRIPLFIVWDGKISPKISPIARSQMDIAPSILDLVEINTAQVQFQGQSVFDDKTYPIYLIQPYVKHLSVIRYPLKYRLNTRLQKEYVYHLENDPMETQNILSVISQEDIELFRSSLREMYINDHFIRHNIYQENPKH